jgi:predicted nucleic acid-binding protein
VTIVADTSVIHYAVLIGIVEVIFDLYGQILIPSAVHVELTDVGAPIGLRYWLERNLDRVEIRSVLVPDDPFLRNLDEGEMEAIFLAQQIPDSLLLIDDRDGRKEAKRRGLRISGLLGVIRNAALAGYLDFDDAMNKLKATDFRLSAEVEGVVRAQYDSER